MGEKIDTKAAFSQDTGKQEAAKIEGACRQICE